MLLTEGDRVAADAVLLSCNGLLAGESMLTGESVPARKHPGNADSAALQPGGDDQPFVYAGTVLVQGSGIALATATGKSSAIGQIGASLADCFIVTEMRHTLLASARCPLSACCWSAASVKDIP